MSRASAFTELVRTGEHGLEPMLLSLAADVGRATGDDGAQALRGDQAYQQLGRLAGQLERAVRYEPARQMGLIAELIAREFTITPEQAHRTDLGDLRPDLVLGELAGHPVLVAAACAAAAQRGGLAVAIAASDDHILLAHTGMQRPAAVVVGPRPQLLADATELHDRGLSWRCAHEVSALILDLIAGRAAELGLHPVHVRARELALALPLDPEARSRRELELHRAQSAWN